MTAYAPGTRVKIEAEGVVDETGLIRLRDNVYFCSVVWASEHPDTTVTVLAEPRPDWADVKGVVVLDCEGDAWQRAAYGWHVAVDCDREAETYETVLHNYGPLRLIHDPRVDGAA